MIADSVKPQFIDFYYNLSRFSYVSLNHSFRYFYLLLSKNHQLIFFRSAVDFRSSTPVPLTSCSPTLSERSRLLGDQSRRSGDLSRHSGDLSDRARLLGDSGDHSNGSSSINSSVQTVAENPGPSGTDQC